MIMKSQKDLDDLPISEKLYVAFAPKIEVYDNLFIFNTTANVNAYYPIFIFEKKDNITFVSTIDTIKRKRSYNMIISNI